MAVMTVLSGRRMKSKRQLGLAAMTTTDPYVKLAQKEGYRARAAYKLREIDETCSS